MPSRKETSCVFKSSGHKVIADAWKTQEVAKFQTERFNIIVAAAKII